MLQFRKTQIEGLAGSILFIAVLAVSDKAAQPK